MFHLNIPRKVILFAPFWRQVGHVGNLRMDRFVRWLADDGFHIVLVRAGAADVTREEVWGAELTVRDPMDRYRSAISDGLPSKMRKQTKMLRTLAHWIFNPDPGALWARIAARHPAVREYSSGAAFILSSSPPESAHIGAWKLSKALDVPHIVDLRDGWLDEPLKPLLRFSTIRRWQEGRLESTILHDARAIQVTSDVWQDFLCKRLPSVSNKVSLITNGYPPYTYELSTTKNERKNIQTLLVHAGRFSGSDTRRTPDLLLKPLLHGINYKASQGVIKLFGTLSADELEIIDRFKLTFAKHNWHIECSGIIPHNDLLKLLPTADGLLLLSTSFAAIPSKLFEYIPTGRPLLVVTARDSACWRICEKLPQAILVETNMGHDSDHVVKFLQMISSTSFDSDCPLDYSEIVLRDRFIKAIEPFKKISNK